MEHPVHGTESVGGYGGLGGNVSINDYMGEIGRRVRRDQLLRQADL